MEYTVSNFRRDYRNGAYAWPGGYPKFFITSDGEALDYETAKSCRRYILESIAGRTNDGWRVVGCDINWEDEHLYCANSDRKIPSAYGD